MTDHGTGLCARMATAASRRVGRLVSGRRPTYRERDVKRRLVFVAVALAVLGVGLLVGALVFPRTTTKVVVETRTVTEAGASGGQTLHVQIIDTQPYQEGTSLNDSFPLDACSTDANFPDIENVVVTAPEGELLGLTDRTTLAFVPMVDEYACVMEFDVPDLAASRFYLIEASGTFLGRQSSTWRTSAYELERNGWSIRVKL